MKKILLINGPNLQLLGVREPGIYGVKTLAEIVADLRSYAVESGCELVDFQSNGEGALVDRIGSALAEGFDGIIINPAAYTHTSIAILDALKAVGIPAVEVHISDVDNREDFRKLSYAGMACRHTIKGQGINGYKQAIEYLIANYK